MKVGDLVIMPNASGIGDEAGDQVVGIVVKMGSPASKMKHQTPEGKPRAGVIWSDGGGRLDWEPMAWLKVINESR